MTDYLNINVLVDDSDEHNSLIKLVSRLTDVQPSDIYVIESEWNTYICTTTITTTNTEFTMEVVIYRAQMHCHSTCVVCKSITHIKTFKNPYKFFSDKKQGSRSSVLIQPTNYLDYYYVGIRIVSFSTSEPIKFLFKVNEDNYNYDAETANKIYFLDNPESEPVFWRTKSEIERIAEKDGLKVLYDTMPVFKDNYKTYISLPECEWTPSNDEVLKYTVKTEDHDTYDPDYERPSTPTPKELKTSYRLISDINSSNWNAQSAPAVSNNAPDKMAWFKEINKRKDYTKLKDSEIYVVVYHDSTDYSLDDTYIFDNFMDACRKMLELVDEDSSDITMEEEMKKRMSEVCWEPVRLVINKINEKEGSFILYNHKITYGSEDTHDGGSTADDEY
jgi:hypothetical protein